MQAGTRPKVGRNDARGLLDGARADPSLRGGALAAQCFHAPTLARPVPLETLVRAADDLARAFTHEYWRKLDLVECVRYTEPGLVAALHAEWPTVGQASCVDVQLVDAYLAQLECVC